jgi:hypothetical protein
VVYVMSGAAHLPYFVVSCWTLRHFWDGPVDVYSWPTLRRKPGSGSYEIMRRIAKDRSLGIQLHKHEPKRRGRNSQFEDKQLVMMQMQCDSALYLDADTMICGDVVPILGWAEQCGFCATQFNQWVTTGNTVRGRIERLRPIEGREQFSEINQDMVDEVLRNTWPSVNGGVFACQPSSELLPFWHKWTCVARPIFISDETVLHILVPRFTFINRIHVMMGGAYNCSPKYQPPDLADEDVVIWHFHGDSNLRPGKSQKGADIWYPIYRKCLVNNVGKMQEWIGDIDNKYLRQYEESLDADP